MSQSGGWSLKRPQVILSLCDGLGGWSAPYIDNDYDVIQIDALTGQDVRLMELPAKPIHGILAAPPCTMFANSGARWVRTREQMLEALSVVDAGLVGAREPARQAQPLSDRPG